MELILVLNCGSSSVKYTLFDVEHEREVAGGAVERIGEGSPRLTHQDGGRPVQRAVEAADHDQALMQIHDVLLGPDSGVDGEVVGVGHRVVHGGEAFVESTLITPAVERTIEEYFALAPLHNPPNLAGIRAARRFYPQVPHVAVFDTAFHQSMPAHAYLYALPYELYREEHIRKYGFHGTSHRYVSMRAAQMLGRAEAFTGITCHLGNGCSLAAVRRGRSVDTSMGLTPLEGVVMGTRSGDIDPAIIFHLSERLEMPLSEVNQLLQRRSGLLGLSGVSNDMREVEKAAATGDARAELALAVFAYRVRKYIGAYLAVLGRIQAVVLTGGIGANGADMRRRILEGLDHLGLVFDAELNRACRGQESDISAPHSPVRLLVIPTNEELLIARDTRDIVLSARERQSA
ncbi:MAG: acetate kinase [Candidatus Latescibacterota bacterium]